MLIYARGEKYFKNKWENKEKYDAKQKVEKWTNAISEQHNKIHEIIAMNAYVLYLHALYILSVYHWNLPTDKDGQSFSLIN